MTASSAIFLEIVLGSVAVLALLLLLDYGYHKAKPQDLPITQIKNEPSKIAVPIAIPTPELLPLPKLEPLSFTTVLRKSFADYRTNLMLIVPSLVLFVQNLATAALASEYVTPQAISGITSAPFSAAALHVIGFTFVESMITLLVSFVVLLGQVSMTGKVVSNGKTTLSDWGFGVKSYFLTVFGISVVFSLLFVAVALLSRQFYGNLKPLGSMTASLSYYLLEEPLSYLIQSVFYVCLAGAGIDGRQFGPSLRAGWRVISDRRSAFAGFFVISSAVSLFFVLLAFLVSPFLKNPSLSPLSYVVGLTETILPPLWFLIAFRLYRGFNEPNAAPTQLEPTNRQEEYPRVVVRKQFCIQCGIELPIGSRYCSRCGSRQEA